MLFYLPKKFTCRETALLIIVSFFTGCFPKAGILTYEKGIIILNDSIHEPDPFTLELIMPYKAIIDREMNDVLIVSETAMLKGQPESMLGNLVADLTLKKGMDYYKSHIDFCLLNNGGLRTALPEGEITRGKVFELMPFENELVVLTLSGEKAQQLFNYVARSEGVPVSGLHMGIKNEKAVNILVNNKAFDPDENYKVITSDYLANGGDKMAFFKEPVKTELLNIKIRDAIIEYMEEEHFAGRKLASKLDGRVYFHE